MQKVKQNEMNIGKNLKRLRNEAGYTQEYVVTQMQLFGCQTSRSVYSQIERGSYSVRLKELAALKEIYKCSWDDIFMGIEIDRSL